MELVRQRRMGAKLVGIIAIVGLAAIAPASADHEVLPDPGDKIYSLGGTVDVTIGAPTASYLNELYARVNGGPREFIADNKGGVGSTVEDIGPFNLGDEIIFEIDVFPQGSEVSIATYSTGPASRNPDNIEHAVVIECGTLDPVDEPNTCVGRAGDLYVGFEDLDKNHVQYDHDFDDHVFVFEGTLTRRVPTELIANPSLVDVNLSPLVDIYLQVSATLTGPDGPIAGKEISFHSTGPISLLDEPLCTGLTDSNGLASCGALLDGDPTIIDTILGIGQYEARFAGTLDAQSATDIGPIVAVLGTELLAT